MPNVKSKGPSLQTLQHGGNCTHTSDLKFAPTLLTPSFGNLLFANYHVLKHPLTNLVLSSFYIPKVLKSAANIKKISSQIKI